MCYAIPGKIISIENNIATINYFGEHRKARVMPLRNVELKPGVYVFAQGGIIVGTTSEKEALETLKLWKDKFMELKHTDEQQANILADETKILTYTHMQNILQETDKEKLNNLHKKANSLRAKHIQNACCVHGIIEFSNYCQNDCNYCGINKNNKNIKRYRMSPEEIIQTAEHAVNELGFKALVLQSGEDQDYTDEILISIIKQIHERCGVLLFLSIGERPFESYKKFYEAGAYGALLRFETSNATTYKLLHSNRELAPRLKLIKQLKQHGFILATGFIVGLPGETEQDLINNILLTKAINPDMFSFGPLIPHICTPLAKQNTVSMDHMLKTITITRLVAPDSHILVTTALETLHSDAKRQGLLSGANSLMINLTPEKYRENYDIYPNKVSNKNIKQLISETIELLYSLGRAPTDLGVK